jgi:phenylpyruvate tautomerase
MPLLEIHTNCSVENIEELGQQASKLAADMLGKPESYVMVKVMPEQALIFAGQDTPAAHLKLKSLGLPEDRTADYSEQLCSFISHSLGIDSGRIYIEFSSPQRHMWGWDKRTF